MDELKDMIQEFRRERDWNLSDTPNRLVKSIFVEASELLECMQWGDEVYDLAHLQAELADVLMYALSLCYDLNLNPKSIIEEKMVDVAKRYPKVNP